MNSTPNPTRLSLAIVGLSFGRHILNDLHRKPTSDLFQLAAVCDLQKKVADELAASHGVKAYYSLDDVLADDSIAVVGLYTQPRGRAELLRKIIRAGKDVMTTKPFELDSAEAESVLREAQKLGRVIHLNSPGPKLSPDLEQIQTWVEEFDLGRLVAVRGDVWANYFEKADGTWMDDAKLCPGGAMMRLGIYLINDIVDLAGSIDRIDLISSRVRTGRPTPDNAILTMSCAGGCLASVYASFCVEDGDHYSNGLVLNYERGTVYRNVGGFSLAPRQHGAANLSLVKQEESVRRVVAEKVFHECSGLYQWENLVGAITNRESIDDGYVERIVQGVKILETMGKISTVPQITVVPPITVVKSA